MILSVCHSYSFSNWGNHFLFLVCWTCVLSEGSNSPNVFWFCLLKYCFLFFVFFYIFSHFLHSPFPQVMQEWLFSLIYTSLIIQLFPLSLSMIIFHLSSLNLGIHQICSKESLNALHLLYNHPCITLWSTPHCLHYALTFSTD